MIRRLFFAAIAAGVLAGVIISAVHQVTTVPIILHAEEYENAGDKQAGLDWRLQPASFRLAGGLDGTLAGPRAAPPLFRQVHGTEQEHANEAWAPADGAERILYTAMTTILTAVGFGLLLVAGMALRGDPIDARRGVLWGACGFIAFTLAPVIGLPPEIPGAAAADLVSRQGWWIAAAVTAAAGLWLLVFSEHLALKIIGVVVALIPHLVGAPQPMEYSTGGAPAELAAHFVAASIVVSALFWALLGGFAGHFFGRSATAD